MRFAASINGIQSQSNTVRREIEILEKLEEEISGNKLTVDYLSPDAMFIQERLEQRLTWLIESVRFRKSFLLNALDEVQHIICNDYCLLSEFKYVLSHTDFED